MTGCEERSAIAAGPPKSQSSVLIQTSTLAFIRAFPIVHPTRRSRPSWSIQTSVGSRPQGRGSMNLVFATRGQTNFSRPPAGSGGFGRGQTDRSSSSANAGARAGSVGARRTGRAPARTLRGAWGRRAPPLHLRRVGPLRSRLGENPGTAKVGALAEDRPAAAAPPASIRCAVSLQPSRGPHRTRRSCAGTVSLAAHRRARRRARSRAARRSPQCLPRLTFETSPRQLGRLAASWLQTAPSHHARSL